MRTGGTNKHLGIAKACYVESGAFQALLYLTTELLRINQGTIEVEKQRTM